MYFPFFVRYLHVLRYVSNTLRHTFTDPTLLNDQQLLRSTRTKTESWKQIANLKKKKIFYSTYNFEFQLNRRKPNYPRLLGRIRRIRIAVVTSLSVQAGIEELKVKEIQR